MAMEEQKQVGYPLSPVHEDCVAVFSVVDNNDQLPNANSFVKQEGIDWHLWYTESGQMLDSAGLEGV